jgi:hypothetical protein
MRKQYLGLYILIVSGILLLSVSVADTFSNEVLSDDDFPFVGLRMEFNTDQNDHNETFLVLNENDSYYFVQLYTEETLFDNSSISKDVTGNRTYSWYISDNQNIGGWPCWIDISTVSIGDFVSLGSEYMFNISEQTTYSTNTTAFDVWVVQTNESSAAYYYETNYGALVGYYDGSSYHDLVECNFDLTIPPREYHPFTPTTGSRLTWISDSGYNETVVVTGNDSTYYNVDIYTDEELVGSSQITKEVYSENCYYFVAYDTEWAGWIDPTGLSIGQTIRPSGYLCNITALNNFTTPLGTFELWSANSSSGLTYYYEIDTGIMVMYYDGSNMRYLTYFNGEGLIDTTTTVVTTTIPTTTPTTTTTTTTITSEPTTTTTTPITTTTTTTTNEESSTTVDPSTSIDESTETTSEESSSDQTSEITSISITPGFTTFGFITLGGILILRKRLK